MRAAIALAIALLAAPLSTEAGEARDTERRLVELLQVRRPEGAGPFPAIMLVPVCSGMSRREHATHYREMAERLNRMDYLVVHVDYVGARRLAEACGSFVSPAEIANDIFAVVKHLRALPLVDPARIDVIGESRGGGGCSRRSPGLAPISVRRFGEPWSSTPCAGASRRHERAPSSSCCLDASTT